jgi:glycosyltransferase involved in cell wall biosynthesis
MRIVLVTPFYPSHGGGVEKVAAQLASRLARLGHTLEWCASDTDTPPALPGVRCVPMRTFNAVERLSGFPYPLWPSGSLRLLATLIRSADAVHVHDAIYAGSLAAAVMARRNGKRLIATQHIGTVPLPRPLQPVLGLANRLGARVVLQRASGVAFISPAVRRYFESLVGPQAGFHDVPNGVDTDTFHPPPGDKPDGRQALGFDPDRPLMLFVGRFVAKKRLHLLREMAVARPDWQWCVIGRGPERPQDWGLPQVKVLSPMDAQRLAEHYRAADLLVLPSHGEGFPLVVQEAMACGLPACITAEVAAGSTLPGALWLPLRQAPGQTAAWGVADIQAWLQQDPGDRLRQRRACAEFARHTWSWDAAAQSHADWLSGAAS